MYPENDTLARQSGDKFTVILQSLTSPPDAISVVSKIMKLFKHLLKIGKYKLFTSVSIGISFYPTDGNKFEALIKNAETAMHLAKAHGENNYRIYTQSMNYHFHEWMILENDLRYAIDREEFVLFYQSQINISTGHVVGAEALIRWQHPQRGLLSPDLFIPTAE